MEDENDQNEQVNNGSEEQVVKNIVKNLKKKALSERQLEHLKKAREKKKEIAVEKRVYNKLKAEQDEKSKQKTTKTIKKKVVYVTDDDSSTEEEVVYVKKDKNQNSIAVASDSSNEDFLF